MPTEPEPSRWRLPSVETADETGLVGVGADEEPGTILAAYRRGIFPMPIAKRGPMGWWSPDPRGVLELDQLRVSRSLRRSIRRFEIRVDTSFAAVVEACADPRRAHGWIDGRIRSAYLRLHDLGWCHSVETWRDDELVGGLYGITVGGLFAGESMFHTATDASKAALVALVDALDDGQRRLIDVQWLTDHLRTLGATEWPRSRYISALRDLGEVPHPAIFGGPGPTIGAPRGPESGVSGLDSLPPPTDGTSR